MKKFKVGDKLKFPDKTIHISKKTPLGVMGWDIYTGEELFIRNDDLKLCSVVNKQVDYLVNRLMCGANCQNVAEAVCEYISLPDCSKSAAKKIFDKLKDVYKFE